MMLSVLTVMATQAAETAEVLQLDDETLPLGFLEYLGGMVEVERSGERTLLDPLDFEDTLESEKEGTGSDRWPEQSTANQSREVSP